MAEDNDLSEAVSSKNAMKAGRGIRFTKIIPHGAR